VLARARLGSPFGGGGGGGGGGAGLSMNHLYTPAFDLFKKILGFDQSNYPDSLKVPPKLLSRWNSTAGEAWYAHTY
jgi:hypothetical protein